MHLTLATNALGQLNVLGHDGHTLGVDRTEVCVLKQANQVRLRCLLKSQNGLYIPVRKIWIVLLTPD
jgi:hypothetical protein